MNALIRDSMPIIAPFAIILLFAAYFKFIKYKNTLSWKEVLTLLIFSALADWPKSPNEKKVKKKLNLVPEDERMFGDMSPQELEELKRSSKISELLDEKRDEEGAGKNLREIREKGLPEKVKEELAKSRAVYPPEEFIQPREIKSLVCCECLYPIEEVGGLCSYGCKYDSLVEAKRDPKTMFYRVYKRILQRIEPYRR